MSSLKARRAVAALSASITLGIAGAALPAQAATTTPLADGYYSEPYSSTIYQVSSGYHFAVDAQDYAAAGSPATSPAPTHFVHYPWSGTIFGVTYWPDDWQTDQLTAGQWGRAGSPKPEPAGWIDGSRLQRYDTGSEIFLTDPDGLIHKLSYAEWLAAGSREPDQQSNEGYLKLSWSPAIYSMFNLALGYGHAMTYAEWSQAGFPTPKTVPWIAGEEWFRYSWSSTIYYQGPGGIQAVSAAQWRAAGSPKPRVY